MWMGPLPLAHAQERHPVSHAAISHSESSLLALGFCLSLLRFSFFLFFLLLHLLFLFFSFPFLVLFVCFAYVHNFYRVGLVAPFISFYFQLSCFSALWAWYLRGAHVHDLQDVLVTYTPILQGYKYMHTHIKLLGWDTGPAATRRQDSLTAWRWRWFNHLTHSLFMIDGRSAHVMGGQPTWRAVSPCDARPTGACPVQPRL